MVGQLRLNNDKYLIISPNVTGKPLSIQEKKKRNK